MSTLARYLLAMLVFAVVWLTGAEFGIHPTVAEGLLVVVACAAGNLVHELAS